MPGKGKTADANIGDVEGGTKEHAAIDPDTMTKIKPALKLLIGNILTCVAKFVRGEEDPYLHSKIAALLRKPKPTTAMTDLSVLVHLFPIYLKAILVRYFAIEDPDDSPSEYLQRARSVVDTAWFAKEYTRIRNDWIPQHLDRPDCKLSEGVATDCAQYLLHAMPEVDKLFISCAATAAEERTLEILWDDKQSFRNVIAGSVDTVLRTRLEVPQNPVSEADLITLMLHDVQSDIAVLGDDETRSRAAILLEADDDDRTAEDDRELIVQTCTRVDDLEHYTRQISTQVTLLLKDIRTLLADGGGRRRGGNRSAPKALWYDDCDDATKEVKDEEACVFGTYGQTMNERQKAGQKQKDAVVKRYAHLLHAEGASWGPIEQVC